MSFSPRTLLVPLVVPLPILAADSVARAAEPAPARASLEYRLTAAPAACPDEASFKELVAARLGYEAFELGNPLTIAVRIDPDGKRFVGSVAIRQGDAPARTRTLSDSTCEHLASTLASSVAIVLDPAQDGAPRAPVVQPATAAPPPAPVAPPVTLPAPPPGPAPPPPAPRRPTRLLPGLAADALLSVGQAPAATLGSRFGGSLRYGAFGVLLEGRLATTPVAAELTDRDRVQFTHLAGGLGVCGHVSALDVCGVGSLGSLQAKALDVSRPSLRTTLQGVVGGRVGVTLPLTAGLEARAHAEAGIPLTRTTYSIDDASVWTSAVVQLTASLGLGWRFR